MQQKGPRNSGFSTPCYIFVHNFLTRLSLKKLNVIFFFDQVSIDTNCVLTLEKCPLVAELKLKMLQNGYF